MKRRQRIVSSSSLVPNNIMTSWLYIFLFVALFSIETDAIDHLHGLAPLFEKIMTNATNQNNNKAPSLTRFRKERFPSIDERVQIYMSNWYAPPCHDDDRFLYSNTNDGVYIHNTNMTIQPHITPDMLLLLKQDVILDCARSSEELQQENSDQEMQNTSQYIDSKFRSNMYLYCADVVEMFEILHHLPESTNSNNLTTPYLMQFGDMKHSHKFGVVSLVHFRKFRSSTDDLQHVISDKCVNNPRPILPIVAAHGKGVLQPIIWKLGTRRHFKHLPFVSRFDTPWNQKKNMAIFRGQLTGAHAHFSPHFTVEENCNRMVRCRLVQTHANSTLVNAKLNDLRNRLPSVVGGVNLTAPKAKLQEMMQYKAIIMLEGNDVASGLKWALLSQSVVLMSKPSHTSWAMEELLEPWIHYVPLNDMATDVEERMQWIIDHDDEARQIAERSSLWIEDLVFHPDAARDDRLIKEEMIRRYRAHFKAAPSEVGVSQS